MIYMNNAATSWPKSPQLGEVLNALVNEIPSHGSRATGDGLQKETIDCRQQLAQLMEISNPHQVVYMENATRALNTAILGFPWRVGDVVLTTAAEHNSVLRPLYFLKKHHILDYHVLPVEGDGRISMEQYTKALREMHPRMVVFTHSSNVTGAVNDVTSIVEAAKQEGAVTLMDASQTMGMIPVLPQKWEVDLVAFTGHKYLLGPQGTGGLYVANSMELEPIITGGTGIHSDEDEMPQELPLRLEAGTQNMQAFSGLGHAVRWIKAHPLDFQKITEQITKIEEGLQSYGVRFISVKGQRTPILSFMIEGFSTEEVGDILLGNYGIICRTGLHCAPYIFPYICAGRDGTVRISLSRFTTDQEVDCLLEGVKEIACE